MDLQFRKYQAEEFEDYFMVVKDDKVMKYITGKGLTREEALFRFKQLMELNTTQERLGYFKISEGENFIGSCKLEPYKRDPSVLEVGYILKEEFWGKGYGTQICQKMLELADEVNPHQDIIGIIDPDNEASRKLLEKFGFQTYFRDWEDNLATEKLVLKKHENYRFR